ncbi:MAG: bifunctional phosphoribosylaminoimidazolecarboxamide formyltransferase/IMP cyclohydrolase [Chloracidobacterium sp.]|nr:bifunctional phosphoribosylaminoimidazolecarboxamide formyltransferase/IMP cyclohydrolase [Chloracidobacterium sp.]MDW8217432.1 bifunctional phosphoribosylaminoimidazolecarboxamide formyltransferase/IMP cyclohydrolase [Acidobacteriota bacterium]
MTTIAPSRALLSVSDKTGLLDFARVLHTHGLELVSTGGTARALADAGLPVRDVASVTGFPELLDGRVKTLHPRIHAGILARRDLPEHLEQLALHDLDRFDFVIVNLYPFADAVVRPDVTVEEAIENIDIGGPALIRAAAKNFRHVVVVTDPSDYDAVAAELARTGAVSAATRHRLACKAFDYTARYDALIADFFANRTVFDETMDEVGLQPTEPFPPRISLRLMRRRSLRYGENPHQAAALYVAPEKTGGIAAARQLQGKELSFNNLLDADAAWGLAREFRETAACVIVKHTNPCGVGLAAVPLEAFRLARETDPTAAFGGIVAFNRTVDAGTATELAEMFLEVIVAPGFDDPARQVLAAKKNLRLLVVTDDADHGMNVRTISGGFLLQSADDQLVTPAEMRVVTRRAPSEDEWRDLLFAWTVCKHVKSNAVVYAQHGRLVGIGAGQMSRVDAVKVGALKARAPLAGAVIASDAFFPFRDSLDEAARYGVRAVIQPGGSIRDEEVIAAADEHGMAMVLTGLRHFRH